MNGQLGLSSDSATFVVISLRRVNLDKQETWCQVPVTTVVTVLTEQVMLGYLICKAPQVVQVIISRGIHSPISQPWRTVTTEK